MKSVSDRHHSADSVSTARFTLTIDNRVANTYIHRAHATLRDARADLVRYQNRRGYWLTAEPWFNGGDTGKQEGTLRQNGAVVALWRIQQEAAA